MSAKRNLYEVLGVKETATQAEIKKAFKNLTKQQRQDNSPDGKERYSEIQNAYEILSNPSKREWYDEFGQAEEGEEEDAGAEQEQDFYDMFGNMSIFSRLNRQGGMAKCEPLLVRVAVTLEDLYNGNLTKSAHVRREVLCEDCGGEGAKEGSQIHKCDNCKGTGVEYEHHQMGFFINRVSTECSTCSGRGKVFSEEDKCGKCSGNRTLTEDKTVEVRIEPGMRNMQKIEFSGEGNHLPGHLAGDIVAVLDYTEHEEFQRAQDNLVIQKTISLVEALCGYTTLIKHLDGRQLHIHNSPGEVIKSGSLMVVKNEGMPCLSRPFEKGDLLVRFSVEYPDSSSLSSEHIDTLKRILPPAPDFVMPQGENVEEVNMYDLEDMNFAGSHPFQSPGGQEDDDDEAFGGGATGGVQCHTQ
ncbi:dnaJ homolog subfamily A member 2-like [Phlebotomus argentipes]|uniref:dnaJ homolog subfamily A member 2-like n=1 Tax=Phlebotomus argentipes TaxID=94469 RepID=UPI002892D472|nr:dnaJ homolog subfamily A member 2-like [Phlebotomus argentipes]